MHVVNQAIVERADDLGIIQAELARKLGLRAQAVNKWFAGENTPHRAKWPAIEKALRFDPGHLGRLADGVPDEASAPDVVAAIRSDPRLDERARENLIAAYNREAAHSVAIDRARSLKMPPEKASRRKS